LNINLTVGEVSDQEEELTINGVTLRGLRPILKNDSIRIEIVFPSYVAYNVSNESYIVGNEYDLFEGKLAREYSKSRYLDYIKANTIADAVYPGKLRHFGFCGEWHIIDVVAIDEPKINIISCSQS
jgi:hypothetical protein